MLWSALGGPSDGAPAPRFSGEGALPSAYRVTDLASASIAVAGAALAELVSLRTGAPPEVEVDRRLACGWFAGSLRPMGWHIPPVWHPTAGDYRTKDGWIRLHTNTAHHRQVALVVLGTPPECAAIGQHVATWSGEDLEQAIVDGGGCAAMLRDRRAWDEHPQGRAVAAEPVVHLSVHGPGPAPTFSLAPERPLRGVRVLDLTRVLAGPVATRFLAGFGAEVLRIDPPWWEEPGVVPEMTLGKRCARLDMHQASDREQFMVLLEGCDVLVHGYRADALARLGMAEDERERLRPGLVDVSLDAYGWSGPWRTRRGFDSLVQMSSGIAAEGMRWAGQDAPVSLPVQALDHATGYLMAAAVLRGLVARCTTGAGWQARTSLARTARVLVEAGEASAAEPLAPESEADLAEAVEHTGWGAARRLRPPLRMSGAPMVWDYPAGPLGTSPARWSSG